MRAWLASLVGALLPDPERSAFTRRFGGDPPRASFLIGAVEFVGGLHLLYDDAMAYLRTVTDQMVAEFLRVASQRSIGSDEALGLTWGGAVAWVFWLLQPATWLLLSIPVVGLARAVSYLTVREAFGEPSLWALLRAGDLVRRLRDRARERTEFGDADAPDEVLADDEDALLVHTARPRAEWTDGVTLEVAGRFYRVAARDQVDRPAGRRHRYRLVEAPEHEVIRRLLRYDPPGPG